MSLLQPQNFWEYREFFRSQMNRSASANEAAEGTEAYQIGNAPLTFNERLLQAIWAQQLFSTMSMRLEDGRRIELIDPGRWNGGAGPDFLDARLVLDGKSMQGDVELHLKASDWENHQHHRDLAYNRSVLHAVWESDTPATDDLCHNGERLPRLVLEPYIFPDIETLRRSLTPDDLPYTTPCSMGQCSPLMIDMDPQWIGNFLDLAGDERIKTKTRRMREHCTENNAEQGFYQMLMATLGTGPGKTLYYLLARRAPLAEMRDYVSELPREQWQPGFEALLLNVAGLVPDEASLADAHEEVQAYAQTLREIWQQFEPYWNDRLIPPTRRWYKGIRPVNFPARRLAGVAHWLARDLRDRSALLERCMKVVRASQQSLIEAPFTRRKHPAIKDLIALLNVEGTGTFWANHYSFQAKPAARSMTLIGEATAMSLLLNAFIPAAILCAEQEQDEKLGLASQKLYARIPPLQKNQITEFMTKRLFGDHPRAKDLVDTERRRQGLFQIFYHCCQGEERHCERCYYWEARP